MSKRPFTTLTPNQLGCAIFGSIMLVFFGYIVMGIFSASPREKALDECVQRKMLSGMAHEEADRECGRLCYYGRLNGCPGK